MSLEKFKISINEVKYIEVKYFEVKTYFKVIWQRRQVELRNSESHRRVEQTVVHFKEL